MKSDSLPGPKHVTSDRCCQGTRLPHLRSTAVAWMRLIAVASVQLTLMLPAPSSAEARPGRDVLDSRIRTSPYSGDRVYRLRGYVGYQIDLQFEPGEQFIGLGSGDLDALSFFAQDNHLFLKPRVAHVSTNLTVLTSRRHYHFDYSASAQSPDPLLGEVIYSLRFIYPPDSSPGNSLEHQDAEGSGGAFEPAVDASLERSAGREPINSDYWYCGHPALKPVAASDDGVHTRLRFSARTEQPAIFVRNDDGTESLLNFSMDVSDVLLHRVVRRLIVRRGKLAGCIVNKAFAGSGARLRSGTVAAEVERQTRGTR